MIINLDWFKEKEQNNKVILIKAFLLEEANKTKEEWNQRSLTKLIVIGRRKKNETKTVYNVVAALALFRVGV